ncbi:hypothetical protein [Okeania sp. SIO2C2]|uniref:hypothetical protein n=1 Tax=Okeania sp. SIO2C2 TaxID=2607787 RepID=UPI0025810BFD|nr:hypothetical protein [Okeania sp. SIO2C2]
MEESGVNPPLTPPRRGRTESGGKRREFSYLGEKEELKVLVDYNGIASGSILLPF